MTFTKQNLRRVALLLLLVALWQAAVSSQSATQQPIINARVAPVLQSNGQLFKDLNKNGKLDVYED